MSTDNAAQENDSVTRLLNAVSLLVLLCSDRGADDEIRVGDELPARLYPEDIQRIFKINQSRFYELQKKGRFDRFEIRPTIGRRAWSGKLVQQYLNGDAHSSRFVVVGEKKRA